MQSGTNNINITSLSFILRIISIITLTKRQNLRIYGYPRGRKKFVIESKEGNAKRKNNPLHSPTTKLLVRKVGGREEGRWYKSIIQDGSAGSGCCINER